MPNPYRAEEEFTVEGRTYRLRFDWNAAVEFETATGRAISDVLADLAAQRVSATALRGLLWAGLRSSEPKLSLEAAGEVLDRLGRREAIRLCGTALRFYFPELGEQPPADPQSPAPSL